MSGIECINLLAFIQFIIAFDFGLYYLDNKHVLTEIYRKYQKDLKLSVREVLSRANDIRTESLKSEDNECIVHLHSARNARSCTIFQFSVVHSSFGYLILGLSLSHHRADTARSRHFGLLRHTFSKVPCREGRVTFRYHPCCQVRHEV